MAFPKQIKKTLPLSPQKTLFSRREELLNYITDNGTYLPKSVLHPDLDRGMLDFVKDELKTTISGKVVPMLDVILTTQNWAQFTETWTFVDEDFNPSPPFITVVRQPEVKYGTNPSLQYTIPNRKQFYMAGVPTWNGNQAGMDIYTIPQPVPVDINYQVRIICNRMRELNQFNKLVLQKFSSRQSYSFIKGQYVPIVMNNITDESISDLDKRKYYVQNYDFTMLGYLIDEEEFEVKPAISRVLTVLEVEENKKKGKRNEVVPSNPNVFEYPFLFLNGVTELGDRIDNMVNMSLNYSENISSFDVYINDQYFGTNITEILANTNDFVNIQITKTNPAIDAKIIFINTIL